MKVKSNWTDFQVDELTDLQPSNAGNYSFYRLTKSGWTTPDAIQIIQRAWNVPFQRISYGGLKDRHAATTQYLTIWKGPRMRFESDRLRLDHLGLLETAYRSSDIAANRFRIVLRKLGDELAAALPRNQAAIEAVGVPNYFDDQRFGSVNEDLRFIAKEMVLGRYEDALKLALTNEYAHDRATAKAEKNLLVEHWTDWKTLKEKLPKGHARSLSDYLVHHPSDFGGALERLRPELQGIYLSAYQSYLWNRLLARWLEARVPAENRVGLSLKLETLPAPTTIPDDFRDEWESAELPLPSARLKPIGDESWAEPLKRVMEAEDLPLEKMKIRLRKPYFSRGERLACLRPRSLSLELAEDDQNPGHQKALLSFDLPAGSYATMVIKRLTQIA